VAPVAERSMRSWPRSVACSPGADITVTFSARMLSMSNW
jgi:hypothetical protein